MKLGVIGTSVEQYSRSPMIHRYFLAKTGIKGTYDALNVSELELDDFLSSATKEGYRGFNVTIPHKEAVYRYIMTHGYCSKSAMEIGAVNTVIIDENGRLCGDNTDGYGFITNILTHPALPLGWDLFNKQILIIGSGGVARAIIAALRDNNQLLLANRTAKNAISLINEMGKGLISYVDYEFISEYAAKAHVIINATSLGMGGSGRININLSYCDPLTLIVDTVYNPLNTPLLEEAKYHQLPAIDGVGMLLYQAQRSFYLWTYLNSEVTKELRQSVVDSL
jgi:shikimate dehydrogenase